MNNYIVKIRVTVSDGDKVKKKTEQYLVQDVSTTAVEATMVKYFQGTTLEWELVGVTKSNILNIVVPKGTELTIL